MTVQAVLDYLWTLCPASYKESWDNVGLLLGRAAQHVEKALISLDLTEGVAKEAADLGCRLIVTHHPAIFKGEKHIVDTDPLTEPELFCLENRIAVISMHTNLDCAPGGVNDVLAEALGLREVSVLDDGVNPGLVRCGRVEQQPLSAFAASVKKQLRCPGLRFVDAGKPVEKVAVGGGSCFDFAELVLAAGCDTFVTSDIKYHQFLEAYARGLNLIDAGHFETEDPVMTVLMAKLQSEFPGISWIRSGHSDYIQYL